MRSLGSTSAWSGGQVTPIARAILAANPGPMTLDGTNTWLLAPPGGDRAIVVDPGPADSDHLRAIVQAAEDAQVRVVSILLTHGHDDHAAGAGELAGLLACPVRALDPAHRLGEEGLRSGEVVVAGDLEVHVVSTPGHTRDSLTFWLPQDRALLTGDTLLGRGSTVVAHPDGRLGEYLKSLTRLRRLAADSEAEVILPGHGPANTDPLGLIDAYVEHRQLRLNQVRSALEAGAMTSMDVVALVYSDVPEALWPAAELSVLAQLEYLDRHG